MSIRGCLLLFVLCLALTAQGQIKRVSFKEVSLLMASQDDSLTVLNFWATWCKPCVAELPDFAKAQAAFRGKPVRFVYVSIDFSKDASKAEATAKRFGLAKTWLLTDTDYNTWIHKVDPDWGGDIPVTLFVQKNKGIRQFADKELHLPELKATISQLLP